MDLEHYIRQFSALRSNPQGGHYSPHKPCMLLAIMELVESGAVAENCFEFNDTLIQRYANYFKIVETESDHLNPWFPFFHLSNDHSDKVYFWLHVPVPGRKEVLTIMSSARSRGDIADNILYVELEQSLYEWVCATESRSMLRKTLIDKWFPAKSTQL